MTKSQRQAARRASMGMAMATGTEQPRAEHPALQGLEPAERREVLAASRRLLLPAGTQVFSPGQRCEGLPLVLEGEVRVQMTGVSGNEIVLYRIGPGQLCTLSVACLLAHGEYRAEAYADADSSVLALPAPVCERLMDESAAFRHAVLRSYGERLQSLMLVIEEVAFRRVDQRLAERLISRQRQGLLTITHRDLAVELGTAREVVSRLLKEFERQGLVHLERGLIELREERGLARIAAGLGVQRTH